jgi:hypothetical protein
MWKWGWEKAGPGVAVVLKPLIRLHALRRLEADLAFLLSEGLVSAGAARAIPDQIRYAPRLTHCSVF